MVLGVPIFKHFRVTLEKSNVLSFNGPFGEETQHIGKQIGFLLTQKVLKSGNKTFVCEISKVFVQSVSEMFVQGIHVLY